MIILENTGRDVFVLPVYGRTASGRLRREGELLVGDAADKVLPHGVTRTGRSPDPVVRLTDDEWAQLGPRNRAFVRSLVNVGALLVHEGSLDEPEEAE